MKKFTVNLYGEDNNIRFDTDIISDSLDIYLKGMTSRNYHSGDFIDQSTGEVIANFERQDWNGGGNLISYMNDDLSECIAEAVMMG
ncbi:MAG: hypothetical protein ACI4TK_18205 [Agathobacter sp.]